MRELPQNIPAEQGLVSSLMYMHPEDRAVILPRIDSKLFMHPGHAVVFEAISAVHSKMVPVDPLSVWNHLTTSGRAGRTQGYPWLVELVSHAVDVERPEVLVDILSNLKNRRDLIALSKKMENSAYDQMADVEECLHESQEALHHVSMSGHKDDGEGWGEILQAMDSREKFKAFGPEYMGRWGVPTLDNVAPIPGGEYVTIAARPGVGKTALMTQISVESARAGIKVLVITLELSRLSMRARLASYMADVSVRDLKEGRYEKRHAIEIRNQPNVLERGRIQAPLPGTPWPKLEAMIRYEVVKHGIQLVLLDQFDKIGRGSVGKGSNEAYAFGNVSIGIMALTKDLGIGFCLLCQLKGDAEGRVPELSDHADSDRPAKDANIVVHLWRNKEGNILAKLQKNRDGAFVGKIIPLEFFGDRQRFVESERSTDPPPMSKWENM